MRTNAIRSGATTYEGGPASPMNPLQALRRSALSCLLWENEFYESGCSIADRIRTLCEKVPASEIASLAIEARSKFHLRHAPLMLLVSLIAKGRGAMVSDAIAEVIQRPDEMCELLSLYWQDARKPLSNQLRKGLAKAFGKFNAYSLAKYNQRDREVRLRDVLFLSHAKPASPEQAEAWKKLIDGTLESPDTWEVSLSKGADKRETFERLLRERKLGYLALLRNLRNMEQAGCDRDLIRDAILSRRGAERVLPFRYVAAARAAPSFDAWLDTAMLASLLDVPMLGGRTIILVDVSGSMHSPLSARSDMCRIDAAAALASIVNCEDLRVFTFSNQVVEVAPRRALSGVDAIIRSQDAGGTYLGRAVEEINRLPHDRLVVVTDEQTADSVPGPTAGVAYMINVASYQRGCSLGGGWHRVDGWSEGVIRWMAEIESM
jgi:60 kDa SS-A/Ro ribonucleoprotein